MSISMNNANIISSLFSNMNGNGFGSSGGSFQSDMLGINYSDYASISSGSYYKLMKNYYSNEDIQKKWDPSGKNPADKKATNAKIQGDATALKKSADALMEQGSKSLFNEVTTTDKDGNKTKGYDTDKIYKAVESFVKNYNALVKSAGSSDASGIATAAGSMVNMTKINSKMLKEIGININSEDHTLVIDEKAFKAADMTKVKSMFNNRGGFGYRASTQSSMIEHHAKSEAAKGNTYNGFGKFANDSSGSIWDGWV